MQLGVNSVVTGTTVRVDDSSLEVQVNIITDSDETNGISNPIISKNRVGRRLRRANLRVRGEIVVSSSAIRYLDDHVSPSSPISHDYSAVNYLDYLR